MYRLVYRLHKYVVNYNQIIGLRYLFNFKKIQANSKNTFMCDIDEQIHILWTAQNSRDQKHDNFLKFSFVLYCNFEYKPHFFEIRFSSASVSIKIAQPET